MKPCLKVKNWEKYQHYKDRNPPWIKLHKSLLQDRAFMLLAPASKCLLMLLWLLASETEQGETTADLDELRFRLRWNDLAASELHKLEKAGFIQINASATLAAAINTQAPATPETERETETEESKSIVPADAETASPDAHQQLIEVWKSENLHRSERAKQNYHANPKRIRQLVKSFGLHNLEAAIRNYGTRMRTRRTGVADACMFSSFFGPKDEPFKEFLPGNFENNYGGANGRTSPGTMDGSGWESDLGRYLGREDDQPADELPMRWGDEEAAK